MRVEIKASLILAGLVALLTILLEVSGLDDDFLTGQIVFLVGAIAINVAVVYWALTETAEESTYGQQLLRSAVIGVVGGLLIVAVSWLLLAVVFPDALEELRQAAIRYMEESGTPPDEFERQVELLDKATPVSQSIPGGLGTLVTSLVAGSVIGVFRRQR